MKSILKKNIKMIFSFVLGMIIAGTYVYATTICNADEIGFNNTGTNLTSANVQDALDEIYLKASTRVNTTDIGTPTYYIFNGENPPTDTSTTDYTTLNKNVYLTMYLDYSYGVCIMRNSKQYCILSNNWIVEKEHIKKVFSDVTCTETISSVECNATDYNCEIDSTGYAYCIDNNSNNSCYINGDGSVNCS